MATLTTIPSSSVPPGTVLTVHGAGLPSQSFIILVWNNSLQSPKVRVTKDGAFDATFTVPQVADGSYILQARSQTTGQTLASVTIAVQKVAPPTSTVPGAPRSLTATAGDSVVALSWLAPTSNGGSAITGYRVYRDNVSIITLTNVTSWTNTGLANGIQYAYQVSAINAIGEGTKSNTVTALPAAPAPPPPPPISPPLIIESITTSAITSTGFTVTAVVDRPCQFWLEYGTTTAYGSETGHELSFNYSTHIQTINNLTAATTYHFRAHAVDQSGQITLSSDQTQATAGAPAPPPPPSGTYPTTTTIAVVTNPSVPSLETIRVGAVQAPWSTKITRVGDAGQRDNYTRMAAWNCDGTLLLLNYPPQTARKMLNGTTYAVLATAPPNGQQWSNVDPNLSWGYSGGFPQTFFSVDWQTGVKAKNYTYSQFASVTLGDGEGTLSNDDQYAVLQTVTSAGQQGIILIDTTNGAILASKTFSTRPNNAAVSQLGKYVVLQFGSFGTGDEQGTQVYDLNLNRLRQISTWSDHCDLGVLNGRDVWVSVSRNSGGGPGFAYLDTGTYVPLFSGPLSNGHVSCRNIQMPGWAVFSSYSYSPGGLGNDQIVAASLATPGQVKVYGWAWNRGNPAAYDQMPFAVPSPDMTKVTFGSVRSGVVYGYVAEMP